jgi:hypothetical protein
MSGLCAPGMFCFFVLSKIAFYDGDGGYTGNAGKKKQAA